MNNPETSPLYNMVRYFVGVTLGFVLGASIFYLIAAPTQQKMLESVKECTEKNIALQRENTMLQQTLIQLNNENKEKGRMLQENYSDITVLYESAPQSGLLTVLSAVSGKPIPQQQGMTPKWVIPMHVVPMVSPQIAPSVRVVYVDKDGKSKDGAPEIAPQ